MFIRKKFTTKEPIQFAGIVVKSAIEGAIKTSDILTCYDAVEFYRFIDEPISLYITRAGGHPSFIERLLVVFHQDGRTDIYLNNFEYQLEARSKGFKKSGDSIYAEDLSGIVSVRFQNLVIPKDAGVIAYLSWMGKKAVFYDVSPLAIKARDLQKGETTCRERVIPFERAMGVMMSHLAFSDIFNIDEDEWELIYSTKWFPFIYLQGKLWDELFKRIKSQTPLLPVVAKIRSSLLLDWDGKCKQWEQNKLFNDELPFIQSAFENYKSGNWIAVSSVLGPRLEGIMLSVVGKYLNHDKLVDAFSSRIQEIEHQKSLLSPTRLQDYCKRIVFRHFNLLKGDAQSGGMNRHMLGHGKVKAEELNEEVATIWFLLIDHLSYLYLPE